MGALSTRFFLLSHPAMWRTFSFRPSEHGTSSFRSPGYRHPARHLRQLPTRRLARSSMRWWTTCLGSRYLLHGLRASPRWSPTLGWASCRVGTPGPGPHGIGPRPTPRSRGRGLRGARPGGQSALTRIQAGPRPGHPAGVPHPAFQRGIRCPSTGGGTGAPRKTARAARAACVRGRSALADQAHPPVLGRGPPLLRSPRFRPPSCR
jgi:hypothetical protein